MNKLLQYYVNILNKIEGTNLRVRNQENKKLSCYFYSKGEMYDGKLMIVGRAENGGTEEDAWIQGDSCVKGIEEFIENRFQVSSRWSLKWVSEWWGRKGFDEKGGVLYNSATPFWQLVKAVLSGINGDAQWDEERWPLRIIWSNIYKFSPMNGGNPNYTLQMLQLNECQKILQFEIDLFKPDNILFVTGENWFNDVKSLFLQEADQNFYLHQNGKKSYIYVCERPEFKSPYAIAQQVISKIIAARFR